MATNPDNLQPNDGHRAIVDRVKRILLQPKTEWAVIDTEATTTTALLKGWVAPLAAIGPIAALIGALVFGYGAFGIHFRPSIGSAVTTALVSYVMAFVGVWVLSLIINALAPTFEATKNPVQALKVAAYAATAGWLAGIFQIVPSLGWLGIVGLYSIYLLYLGLPILMKAPPAKTMAYTVTTIIAAIVVFFVIGAITTAVTSRIAPRSMPTLGSIGSTSAGGKVTIPGAGSIDLGKIEAATKQMEATAKGMQSGEIKPIAPDALQALLPASIAGWNRTEISSQGGAAAGIGGSHAEARYRSGDQSFTLSITDAGALGALATMGGAISGQSSRQTESGYEKTAVENGNMVSEKWDSASSNGSYSTMVASRFAVEADGDAPSIDMLKQAVAAIDARKLVALGN
ncbi:Yip1 family protein [Hephaestia sp. GCM10023244]|uniref:Yip1 family protein n=1 Tax=unclassified Hephaestia TaxID=2631281 RepID=UPI0020776939|nr:Yip1 family protein [Hephaestia sp. MAHUQ-44]MCM8729522.1 YIP1 family protein [Hephaestia sp. MAHUQ-44]